MKRCLRYPLRLAVAFGLLAMAAGTLEARKPEARRKMEEGRQAYLDGRYGEAARAFEAAAAAAEGPLDPAVAWYNMGNALHRLGDPEGAAEAYASAMRSTDLARQADAFYNRGNALAARAEQALETGQLARAADLLRNALDDYRQSLLLAPGARDAKVNFELTQRIREELEEWLQQQAPETEPGEGEEDRAEEALAPAPEDGPEEDAPQEDREDPPRPEEPAGVDDARDAPPAPRDDDEAPPMDFEPSIEEPVAGEGMTEEEARALLDALREEEESRRRRLRVLRGQPEPVDKDW